MPEVNIEVTLWKPTDPLPLSIDSVARSAGLAALIRGYALPSKNFWLALDLERLGLSANAPVMMVHETIEAYLSTEFSLGSDGWQIKELLLFRREEGERRIKQLEACREERLKPLTISEREEALVD